MYRTIQRAMKANLRSESQLKVYKVMVET